MTPKGEQRYWERFDLPVRATLRSNNHFTDSQGSVMVRDICAGGAFFYLEQQVRIGDSFEVELALPAKNNGSKNRIAVIKVSGTVVRTTEEGMALNFENKYRISSKRSH